MTRINLKRARFTRGQADQLGHRLRKQGKRCWVSGVITAAGVPVWRITVEKSA